jgi:glycosyltransferase involved in cell wall biosynthesis
VAPAVTEEVIHLSLDPAEHRDAAAASLPQGDHLLVFGNHYDHKAVGSTVDLLAGAFPYVPIHAFGVRKDASHRVACVESGRRPGSDVDALIATARVVVFPSYYEGFGLPVVKALAYGRTVVVRASPLWHEIAGSTRAAGQLVEFTLPHDLVEAVGKALSGEPLQALPFGGEIAGDPPRWRECARRMIRLVERISVGDARRWCAREHALELGGM